MIQRIKIYLYVVKSVCIGVYHPRAAIQLYNRIHFYGARDGYLEKNGENTSKLHHTCLTLCITRFMGTDFAWVLIL